MQTIYIGYDSREPVAYDVCRFSIERQSSTPAPVKPIRSDELKERGIYYRDTDPLASTEFTYSRFLVPYLNDYKGVAVFVDCDFLFLDDISRLFELFDDKYAVQCVKHDYKPTEQTKMDGIKQTTYPRKNWSSLMLINCEHPKNKQLDVDCVNKQTGAFLHRFQWLDDKDVGGLPYHWNLLEGWYEPTDEACAIHYTRGGPWFSGYQDVDYAEEWKKEYKAMTGNDFKL